jgi:hypothetical protein
MLNTIIQRIPALPSLDDRPSIAVEREQDRDLTAVGGSFCGTRRYPIACLIALTLPNWGFPVSYRAFCLFDIFQ